MCLCFYHATRCESQDQGSHNGAQDLSYPIEECTDKRYPSSKKYTKCNSRIHMPTGDVDTRRYGREQRKCMCYCYYY